MEVYAGNEAISHLNQIPSKVRRLAEDQPQNILGGLDGNLKEMESALTKQVESGIANICEDIDEEVEYVEENAYGQIMQGEDGQYYVVMDKNTSPDIELDKLNNVQVITNNDGTETLILEDTSKKIIASKASSADLPDAPVYNIASADRAAQSSSSQHTLPRTKDRNDMEGDNDEFNAVDHDAGEDGDDPKYLRGLSKQRRCRVYGQCRCPECGQSFVNTARLERHLAVHQIFGSYLCPLCGKTYKYEYNLFYHWRKTCRDMNDIVTSENRKNLEVNHLRETVEEIARKKLQIGPLELGISGQQLYRSSNAFDRGNGTNLIARKSATCKECGVTTLEAHMSRHLAIHKGELGVDEKSIGGGYFCELCGLMFREHLNLIKHWRTGCQEIQASLPNCCDIALDDSALKEMVKDLLKKACIGSISNVSKASDQTNLSNSKGHEQVDNTQRENSDFQEGANIESKKQRDIPIRSLHPLEANTVGDADLIDVVNNQQNEIDEQWANENAILFADDYMDDEEEEPAHMVMSDEGHFLSERTISHQSAALEQERHSVNQTVQCNECYRSFANVARLERHLAGAHCSMGTHHCILCGNRFKYDYNLLYHYRRSCGYTKLWIEPEVREQLDAVELKKLVRHLATKEVRVSNTNGTMFSGSTMGNIGHRQELGDSMVRRQMMKSVMPISQQQPHSSASFLHLPHNIQLASRPGLPEARSCPICSIAFYGSNVLNRHMKVAHPHEYELWEPSVFDGLEDTNSIPIGMAAQDQMDHVEQRSEEAQLDDSEGQLLPRQYDIEPPPTLQPESTEVEQESSQPTSHHPRMGGQLVSLQAGGGYGQYVQQQRDWSAHPNEEDLEQERIEVMPPRRVIQTRQRTRSGFKEQEINDPPTYFMQQVEEAQHEVRHYHHLQYSSQPQTPLGIQPSKPAGLPSVLRRSTRASYPHHNY